MVYTKTVNIESEKRMKTENDRTVQKNTCHTVFMSACMINTSLPLIFDNFAPPRKKSPSRFLQHPADHNALHSKSRIQNIIHELVLQIVKIIGKTSVRFSNTFLQNRWLSGVQKIRSLRIQKNQIRACFI
jgi:hypothetical protein